jgi:hypothetical protein
MQYIGNLLPPIVSYIMILATPPNIKKSAINYLLNRMNTYPLTRTSKHQEHISIIDILKNNGYQQSNTSQKHSSRNTNNNSHTQTQHEKQKWATFTYSGPEIRTITNLFRRTNLRMAYRTNSKIKELLKQEQVKPDIYNQSGIYQIQCGECPLKYIGQTGRTFRVRYKEHINAIKTNKQNSKFSQRMLDTQHNYNTIDQSIARKRRDLNLIP